MATKNQHRISERSTISAWERSNWRGQSPRFTTGGAQEGAERPLVEEKVWRVAGLDTSEGSGLIPQNIAGDGKFINEPARGLGFGTGEEER
jgi:hypothetical protein